MSDIETIATEVAKAARDAALAKLAELGLDLAGAALETFENMTKGFFRVEVRAHAKTLVVDDQRTTQIDASAGAAPVARVKE